MNWLSKHLEISYRTQSPIRPMEGLRGIAVFLVFLVHYSSLIEPFINSNSLVFSIQQFVYKIGNVGVDLFFVLSGYLIYGTLIKKEQLFFPYMYRRIKRIYPTFLFVFAIYILLSLLIPGESKMPVGSLNKILYILQNLLLLPGIFEIIPIITVAWSLSYELFYYILIPVILLFVNLRKWTPVNRVILWCGVSLVGFLLSDFYANNFRLIMFVSGILLYELMDMEAFKLPKFSGLISLTVALALYGYLSILHVDKRVLMLVLFILFFIVCFESFTHKNGSAIVFNYTPLRWLGNMSYSYYLIHGITLKAVFMVVKNSSIVNAFTKEYSYFYLWIPLFIFTLISSFALFIGIEKPFSLAKSKS